MADIFISYARQDRDKIEKLAAALEGENYSVWWDRNIVGGAEFSAEIEKELDASGVVIVVWSEAGKASHWVRDEAARAQRQQKLIPVTINDVESPMGFGQYQAIDLSHWTYAATAPAFQDLSRAVKARLTGEAPPAAQAETTNGFFAKFLQRRKDNQKQSLMRTAIIAAMVVGIVYVSSPNRRAPDPPPSNDVEAGQSTSTPAQPEKLDMPGDNAPQNRSQPQNAAAASNSASIAVLPFADLSPQGDQEYFADGISEEILNVLVRVDGLAVASRTSSFQFKGLEAIGIPAIADELKVRHILEGSVRKSGDTVRITAQLIDGASDQHLWSETYDRTLSVENLFAVQDEIAQEIVTVLGVKLASGSAQNINVSADTQNLDAYDLYLEANERFLRRGNPVYFRETIGLFEQVTQLDPNFARGWAGLAAAASIARAREVKDRDYTPIAQAAADRALALNPDLSMPYAALGRLADKSAPPDHAAAIRHYKTAIEKDPRNATALHWLSYSLLGLGYLEEAIDYSEQCLALAPGYQNCVGNLSAAYFMLGDTEKAMEYRLENLLHGSGFFDWNHVYHLVQSEQNHLLAGYLNGYLLYIRADLWLIDPVYRALTDETYDKEKGLRRILARAEAEGLNWAADDPMAELINFSHGAYDKIEIFDGNVIWGNLVPDYVASPERKRLFREAGLPDYWRNHGFPPQCRPVGADDFECD